MGRSGLTGEPDRYELRFTLYLGYFLRWKIHCGKAEFVVWVWYGAPSSLAHRESRTTWCTSKTGCPACWQL